MQGTFHWVRVQVFCYATENEALIRETMTELLGTDEFDSEVTEGEHGNRMIIMQAEMSKEKDTLALFGKFGEGVIDNIKANIESRIDDDCVFYLRLDKQKAVNGVYKVAHHGDVISITAKVASHPARKEIAEKNLIAFLGKVTQSPAVLSSP